MNESSRIRHRILTLLSLHSLISKVLRLPQDPSSSASRNRTKICLRKAKPKENIWLKEETGEFDDKKCDLICYLNFHGLLQNLSAVVCVLISLCGYVSVNCWGGGMEWVSETLSPNS